MKNRFAFLTFFFLLTARIFGAEPEIGVRVDPPVIGVEEQASVSVQLDRRAKEIEPAKNDNYEIAYSGESHSSQVTFVNGVIQSKNSFIYTFVLSPKKTGTFNVGPFQVKIDDKTYTSSPKDLQIKVVRQAQKKEQGSPGDIFSEIDDFFHSRNKIPQVGFKLIPRNVTPLQNQQVVLDGYILASDRSAFNYQFSQVSDIRSDKCALYDISDTVQPEVTRMNGLYRKLVKRYVIYPIESGKIGIAPPNIIAVTPFGQIQLKTDVIGIDSKKLNDRSGLSYVGDLSVSFQLSRNRLEVGKNGEWKLTLTGNGNLKVLSNPYGDLHLDGLYFSAPVTETRFKTYRSNKAYFQQEVKYLLIAKKKGEFQIPPLVINYFDDQGQSKNLKIPPQTITTVEKDQNVVKGDLALRPLGRLDNFRYLLFSPWTALLTGIFLLLPFVSLFYGKHRLKMEQDPDYARKIQAGNKFNHYFSLAKVRLDENDRKGFYTAVQNGVVYFITDKLNLPSGTPYRNLVTAMRDEGITEEAVKIFDHLWNVCNRNAFSGQDTDAVHQEIMKELKKLTELIK